MARSKRQGRYSQWKENEEEFAAYVPETDEDAIRKRKRDAGVPQYTTLHIPYSYAIAMTAHTYYTSVFLARNPVLQVAGRHGESEMQVQAMEALLDYQLQVGGMVLPLFFWLFDPIKYGEGFIGLYWDEEHVRCRKRIKRKKTFLGIQLDQEEVVDVVEDVVGYAGHRAFNVRPQDAFPDPRVSVWNFQAGEFFARYVELSHNELESGIRSGKFFHDAKIVREDNSWNRGERDIGSSAVIELPGRGEFYAESQEVPAFIRAYEFFIKVIPREWGLADSDKEEIWVIYLHAGNYQVFGAVPLGEYHGKFPFDVLIQEPEAYSTFARSMMEVMTPLNEAITWLINSHMYNVRSALNNMFAVDPSMVVMKDLENPEPGKLIRLKPAAYGRDIRTMLAQFSVTDVTQGHVPNMHLLGDFMQRITGVTDNIMGMVNAGGRKTATEVRQSTTFGINRLKTTCEFFSILGFAPFTQKLIQGSQQHFDMQMKLKVVGDLAAFTPRFLEVDQAAIAGFFDFVPVDGSLPVDRFAQANLWQTIMAQMSKVPQVAAQYDFAKVFAWVASLAGLKNIQQFRVRVGDPAMLAAQAQAGNLVPVQSANVDLGRPPNQMQIPGMGATA
jgi:hypothetical protein